MNIVLIGFMGTGKSAVGRALARRLGARFVDTDAEIERAAGKPIRSIFAEDGEPAFRARETALLEQLASSRNPLPSEERASVGEGRVRGLPGEGEGRVRGLVLATGGGLPLREGNAALLRKIGRVVWLTAPAETILRRVGPDLSLRPLLAAHLDDPLGRIERLLTEREPHYAAAADLAWDTSRFPTHGAAADLLAEELCHPDAQPRLPPPRPT